MFTRKTASDQQTAQLNARKKTRNIKYSISKSTKTKHEAFITKYIYMHI